MRRDELMVTRPDMMDLVPEGLVPCWTRDLPVADCLRVMELRRTGFDLAGLSASEDAEDLFE